MRVLLMLYEPARASVGERDERLGGLPTPRTFALSVRLPVYVPPPARVTVPVYVMVSMRPDPLGAMPVCKPNSWYVPATFAAVTAAPSSRSTRAVRLLIAVASAWKFALTSAARAGWPELNECGTEVCACAAPASNTKPSATSPLPIGLLSPLLNHCQMTLSQVADGVSQTATTVGVGASAAA